MKRWGILMFLMVLVGAAVGIVSAQDTPVEGGTLRVSVSSITGLDPIFISDDMSMYPSSLVYQFLVRAVRDADGTLTYEGDLAESWDVSEDGTEIIFHLRQGMMFQDGNAVFAEGEGREVVADDVVYSMNRLMTAEGAVVASDLSSSYKSIEAVDDYTVKLTLSSPDGILLDGGRGLSFMAIYPQEAVEQLGDDIRTTPIGSGPFEFVEYVVDERVVLQRNEDYYIRPNLDGVQFSIIPDTSTQALALEAGEIDVMGVALESTDIDRFRDNPAFDLIDTQITYATQIVINVNVPLFSDVRMREAIAKAIDGRGILRAVNSDVLVVDGCGTTGPGWPGFNPDLCQYFPYEPDTSRAILAELGWADSDGDGILEKDGQPLTVPIEAWNIPQMPRQMEAVVTQLREVGFDAQLEVVEFGTWIDDYNAGAEKLMATSGFCCIGGTESYWGAGGFGELMGIKDEEAQALLAKGLTILDPEERSPLIQQAADRIYGQYFAIPLGFMTSFRAQSARVKDFPGYFWWFHLVGQDFNTWIAPE